MRAARRWRITSFWVGLMGLSMVVPVAASITVVVPDDYPTLQAAFDSSRVDDIDSIYVRPGVVEDSLRALPFGYMTVIGLGDSLTRPVIGPMFIHARSTTTFENVHFAGLIRTGERAQLAFRDCRLEGGLSSPIQGSPRNISMDRCRVTGLVDVGFDAFVRIDSCWFDDGRLRLDENFLFLTNCTFTGAGPAVRTTYEVQGEILRNTFRVDGIGIDADNNRQTIADNVFEECLIGIRTHEDGGSITGNLLRGCGTGIVVEGPVNVTGNSVLDSASDGIQLRGYESSGNLEGNVVARSGGDGVVVDREDSAPQSWIVIRNNTSVENDGSGFRFNLSGDGWSDVRNNIGYRNHAHGLVSIGADEPVLTCNDWFANDSSAVSGVFPSPHDLAVDPMFCDLAEDDVRLFAGSPLVNAPDCGLIGARGVGCETAATPLPVPQSRLVLAPVTPNPAVGAVRVRWSLPREEHVDVTIHDVSGRLIATVARGVHRAGLHDVEWRAGAVPSGVYFVRLRGGETSVTRSFLVRR